MKVDKIAKSSQEQAVASWVNYLNQERMDRLMGSLAYEKGNLENAMGTINETLERISKEIVNNGKGRGGPCGMHGFIAEVAECGISNARNQIEGKVPVCVWVNDNGPTDILRGSTHIQQKFVNNNFSLKAIKDHLELYPDYLDMGGKYQIPSDYYDSIIKLRNIDSNTAKIDLNKSSSEFTYKQWKKVNEFFENENINIESIEPSVMEYKDSQSGAYERFIEKEKQNLKKRNQERKDQAYQKSKPSLEEGLNATAVSAAIEGGMTFIIDVTRKRREGKSLKDFSGDDWKEIAGDTGLGAAKGGIRGASIYGLTNYTSTPAAVANSIVTACFGVAEQAHLLRKGSLDEISFIENSEIICLDAAVSALSSFAGQVLIPVPVIGAVIGNAVGTILYQISKDNLSAREQRVIDGYIQDVRNLDAELKTQYERYIDELMESMKLFMDILDKAFVPDIRIAFAGSIELAKLMGVPAEEILDSKEKIDTYFLQ